MHRRQGSVELGAEEERNEAVRTLQRDPTRLPNYPPLLNAYRESGPPVIDLRTAASGASSVKETSPL